MPAVFNFPLRNFAVVSSSKQQGLVPPTGTCLADPHPFFLQLNGHKPKIMSLSAFPFAHHPVSLIFIVLEPSILRSETAFCVNITICTFWCDGALHLERLPVLVRQFPLLVLWQTPWPAKVCFISALCFWLFTVPQFFPLLVFFSLFSQLN